MALSRRERREQKKRLLKEQRQKELGQAEQEEEPTFHQNHYGPVLRFYDKYYKQLLVFPIILFILSLILVGYKLASTGDFINKGVSLQGGVVITIPLQEQISIEEIQALLKNKLPGESIEVRSVTELGTQKAIMITTNNVNAENAILDAVNEKIPDAKKKASAETTGASLGASFFKQTTYAMIIAFILMGIVVFISFRTFAPSVAVIICVFADIVETIAAVNLLGLDISPAGIAAFLMLIGYSVDTDILLTSRVVRGKEGSIFDRTVSAAKTGLLMTLTALAAVIISLIITDSEVIREIMIIILFGLIFDIINTWIQNTAILRWYLEHKQKKAVAAALAPSQARVEEDEDSEDEEENEETLDEQNDVDEEIADGEDHEKRKDE